jgi:hypothetical protein
LKQVNNVQRNLTTIDLTSRALEMVMDETPIAILGEQ